MNVDFLEMMYRREALRDNPPPNAPSGRSEAGAIDSLVNWALRLPRKQGLAFAVEHHLTERLLRRLSVEDTWILESKAVSYANLVQLNDGPTKALEVLQGLLPWPKNTTPYYELMCEARIAQLKQVLWNEPNEYPKRKVVKYIKPYLTLISTATKHQITSKHLLKVDEAFLFRQKACIDDDFLLGFDSLPVAWDHYKCAILDA